MKVVLYGVLSLLCVMANIQAIVPQPKTELGIRQRTESMPTPINVDCATDAIVLNEPGVYALTRPMACNIDIESDNVTLLFGGYTLNGALSINGNNCTVDLQDGSIVTGDNKQAILIGSSKKSLTRITIQNGGVVSLGFQNSGITFVPLDSTNYYQDITIQNVHFAVDQRSPAALSITQAFNIMISSCTVQVHPSATSPSQDFFKGFVISHSQNIKIFDSIITGPMAYNNLTGINSGAFGISLKYCSTVNIEGCIVERLGAQVCLCGIVCKDLEKVTIQESIVQNLELKVLAETMYKKLFSAGIQYLYCSNGSINNNQIGKIGITVDVNHHDAVYHCAAIETIDSIIGLVIENKIADIKIVGLESQYNPQSSLHGINIATHYTEAFDGRVVVHANGINVISNESRDEIDHLTNSVYGISLSNEHMNGCGVVGNRIFNVFCNDANNLPQGTAYAYFALRKTNTNNYFANNFAHGTLAKVAEDYSVDTHANPVCTSGAVTMVNIKTLHCP